MRLASENRVIVGVVVGVLGFAACEKATGPGSDAPGLDATPVAASPTADPPPPSPSLDTPPAAGLPLTGEAKLEGLELGDRACYVQLATETGSSSREGDFELCPGAARDATPLVGKQVTYTAERSSVLAASCKGAADCGKSDTVDLIVTLRAAGAATAQGVALEDLDADTAIGLLGKPARKTSEEWASDGGVYTTWTWPAQGIVLITGPARSVHSVTCEGACTLTTKLGIAVGNTAEDVKRVYGKQINKRESSATDLVVGDAYGGTFFAIEAGKVARIFIGTAAE